MAFIKTRLPCDDCGSSDGRSIDDNGWSKCFVCDTNKRVEEDVIITPTETQKKPFGEVRLKLAQAVSPNLTDRCLTPITAKKFGVAADGKDILFPYYKQGQKEPIAAKRRMQGKRFFTEGQMREAGLFGQQLWAAGGNTITVTEGEFDAMAVHQMMGDWPVVSVRGGAGNALKECKAHFDYLDSFDKIVLCLDNDEVGQSATQALADIFGSKAHIVAMSDQLKDANDYLKAGKVDEFKRSWWNARQYTPEGIVCAADLLEQLKVPLKRGSLQYPFKQLDNMLYGIREAELVTLCAGSGLGKSTILREIAIGILAGNDDPIGLMFLEETPDRTMRGLVGLEMNKPIHLPDIEYDPDEVVQVYEQRQFGSRVYLWDNWGANEIERVLSRMRYFVKVIGCKFIILDHLSILVSDQANNDERKAIDMIMTRLRTFAQEMRITILLVSHLTRPPGKSLEDGAVTSLGMLRGSGAIAQLSDAVIGAERNSQAEDAEERNTTKLRVLKNRFSGKTGPAGYLFYDEETGRLSEKMLEEAL